MAGDARTHLGVAAAFGYPDDAEHERHLLAVAAELTEAAPALAEAVEAIGRYLSEHGLQHAQELYTQTFDMNPAASLDIGWHLFGESYKRGAFLVGLREDLREHDLDEGHELPDHLPTVLRLLARLADGEHAELLHGACVAPSLLQILRTLRGKADNPYVALLEAAAEHYGPPISMTAPSLPVLHDGQSEEALHG